MIGKILVAVDGSERALGVLSAADELAARFDAGLALLRVIVIPPEFPAAGAHGALADALPDLMMRQAMHDLEGLIAQVPRARSARLLVEMGQPWRMILDAAQHQRADLIVLGSHGYGGIDRLIGTTAGKVADRADRNVFIVHTRGGE